MPPDFDFDPEFDAELDQVTTFLVRRSQGAARAFADAFEQAIERALAFPRSGPAGAAGTRSIRIGDGPYSIVYFLTEDGRFVRFVALVHGRRRPGYWRGRL
jgi:plasmid stabilization system protein ParE